MLLKKFQILQHLWEKVSHILEKYICFNVSILLTPFSNDLTVFWYLQATLVRDKLVAIIIDIFQDDAESEILSNAPTDAYISPTSTPRLSRMDAFTPQPVQWDMLSTHSGRVSDLRSPTGIHWHVTDSAMTSHDWCHDCVWLNLWRGMMKSFT